MTDNLEFKDRLREARKQTGLTQQQFSEEVGVASGTYSRYERGALTPSVNVVAAIIKNLNRHLIDKISADWLLFGTGKEVPMNCHATVVSIGGSEVSVRISIEIDGVLYAARAKGFETGKAATRAVALLKDSLKKDFFDPELWRGEFRVKTGRLIGDTSSISSELTPGSKE